jgi:hypothetical protein
LGVEEGEHLALLLDSWAFLPILRRKSHPERPHTGENLVSLPLCAFALNSLVSNLELLNNLIIRQDNPVVCGGWMGGAGG